MNRRDLFRIGGGLGLGLALGGCAVNVVEYRYRLTVAFDTPEGLKSASSVIRVTREFYWPDPFKTVGWKLQGDAVFVDLGPDKHAIALLTHGVTGGSGDSMRTLWVSAYGYPRLNEDVWSGKVKVSGVRELAREWVPTIVTFADITDPASATVILATDHQLGCRPESLPACVQERRPVPVDAVSATLGPGFAFRNATVELVSNDTPVTRGIEERMQEMTKKLSALNSGEMSDRLNAPFGFVLDIYPYAKGDHR